MYVVLVVCVCMWLWLCRYRFPGVIYILFRNLMLSPGVRCVFNVVPIGLKVFPSMLLSRLGRVGVLVFS